MKKSLKVLAGVLTAVTILSSAMAMTVSAEAAVYSTENYFTYVCPAPTTVYETWYNQYYGHYVLPITTPTVGTDCYYLNGQYYTVKQPTVVTEVTLPAADAAASGITSSTSAVKSSVPRGVVRKTTTAISNAPSVELTTQSTVTPTAACIYNPCTLVGGKYYPADKVNINKFFETRTYSIMMNSGEVQIMNTGYKMYSTDSSVVLCYTDGSNQVIKATGLGSAYVYLYTPGGVPFMRIGITVVSANYTHQKDSPVVDIIPDAWRLSKVGDSTNLTIYAPEKYKDLELKVAYGNATLDGNKLTATGTGAIVLHASSKSAPSVQGIAVLYVGEYVNSILDGHWQTVPNGICGNYWNPNLWISNDYIICGWVVVNGNYIPVIKQCDNNIIVYPGYGNIHCDKKPTFIYPNCSKPTCGTVGHHHNNSCGSHVHGPACGTVITCNKSWCGYCSKYTCDCGKCINVCKGHTTNCHPYWVYSDLRDLIELCYGDYDSVVKTLQLFQKNGVTTFAGLYSKAINEVVRDLDLYDYYFCQLH